MFCPRHGNAPAGGTVNEPYTILPGFPNTAASTAAPGGDYPFGIWFANATTLYVCDEGDLIYTPNQVINGQINVADAGTLATAGLQKWVLTTPAGGSPTWVREYVIQNGLDLGVSYSVRELSGIDRAGNGRLPQHRRHRQPRRHGDHLCHYVHDQQQRRQRRRSQQAGQGHRSHQRDPAGSPRRARPVRHHSLGPSGPGVPRRGAGA